MLKRINEEFWNPFGPKCHRTDDLSFCPEPFYLNYKTWTLLASFIAIAPGVSLLSGNVLKNKPLKPFMTFIMHSSRFPNYWLGRMDCDRNDTSLTATIKDAVQNLIWNINLAESYIYIVFWKLILSLTNSYIYNFLMFLAYLTALCQRRGQCFTKQPTVPYSR